MPNKRGRPRKNQSININSQDANEMLNSQIEQFASSLRQQLLQINQMGEKFYIPQVGQDFTQSVNLNPIVPTQRQLTEWLKQPHKFQKQLRDTSQFLDGAIMQYQRSVKHMSSLMSFRYDLRPCDRKPEDEDDKKAWLGSMDSCNKILKKINIKYQFEKINWSIFETGVKFCYLRETDRFLTLQELPQDFCYITGYWDLGYTFAIDLAFFDKIANAKYFAPEFYEYYQLFIKMREMGLSGNELAPFQYYPVPVEKGWVFVFDPVHAQATPPLKGVFKDALEILNYKDLLKQKTTLDTWKLIAQKIPYDKDAKKFIVEYNEAANIVNMLQQLMPSGVRTFATLLDPQEINFNQTQSMNNITGLGESLYYSSIGIAGGLFGMENNTSMGILLSIEADMGYVDHLYRQYENFVNWQLMINSRTYTWQVKFYGNRFTENDDLKNYSSLVAANNMPVSKLWGLAGYEPFEVMPILDLEEELQIKEKMKPIVSAFQQSGKTDENGRPKQDKVTDSGEVTRDHDSNQKALKS